MKMPPVYANTVKADKPDRQRQHGFGVVGVACQNPGRQSKTSFPRELEKPAQRQFRVLEKYTARSAHLN
jgi:hypothetical protein